MNLNKGCFFRAIMSSGRAVEHFMDMYKSVEELNLSEAVAWCKYFQLNLCFTIYSTNSEKKVMALDWENGPAILFDGSNCSFGNSDGSTFPCAVHDLDDAAIHGWESNLVGSYFGSSHRERMGFKAVFKIDRGELRYEKLHCTNVMKKKILEVLNILQEHRSFKKKSFVEVIEKEIPPAPVTFCKEEVVEEKKTVVAAEYNVNNPDVFPQGSDRFTPFEDKPWLQAVLSKDGRFRSDVPVYVNKKTKEKRPCETPGFKSEELRWDFVDSRIKKRLPEREACSALVDLNARTIRLRIREETRIERKVTKKSNYYDILSSEGLVDYLDEIQETPGFECMKEYRKNPEMAKIMRRSSNKIKKTDVAFSDLEIIQQIATDIKENMIRPKVPTQIYHRYKAVIMPHFSPTTPQEYLNNTFARRKDFFERLAEKKKAKRKAKPKSDNYGDDDCPIYEELENYGVDY